MNETTAPVYILDEAKLYDITREQEKALIGACLRGGRKTFEQVREVLNSDDFACRPLGDAWNALERLYGDGMGIDTITVGDELEKHGNMPDFAIGSQSGRVLVADIRENGEPGNALTYALNVQDAAIKRLRFQPIFSKYLLQAQNGRRAADILADISHELSNVEIHSQTDNDTVPIKTAVSEAYDWVDAASRGEVVGVQTGYPDLDKLLGAMYGGNVYIIGARSGQGKSAFLASIIKNNKNSGKHIAIFSLEMSRVQVAQRLIAQEAGIDLHRLTKGTLMDGEWPKYTEAVERVQSWPVFLNEKRVSIPEVKQAARKLHAQGKLDLLMLDYIQIAKTTKKQDRRDLDIGEIMRQLIDIAKELNIPVLAAAQLSREVEKRSEKRPILSDLRESGSLEQDAYAVMFIYRPDQYSSEAKQNAAEIILAKHRNGPVGTVHMVFLPSIARFESAVVSTVRFS